MERVFRIGALVIGLTAFGGLFVFGFILWLLIPLLFGGIAFVLAMFFAERRVKTAEKEGEIKKAA